MRQPSEEEYLKYWGLIFKVNKARNAYYELSTLEIKVLKSKSLLTSLMKQNMNEDELKNF